MPDVQSAKLLVTQSDGDAIEFKVAYVVQFNREELGHTFTESFSLFERDETSDDDQIATGLARGDFVADTQFPFRVARTLTAALRESDVKAASTADPAAHERREDVPRRASARPSWRSRQPS
jgi:hypothetical protein